MGSDLKLPVPVDTTVAESVANKTCGVRYGIDWIYHDDELGYLPAKPCETLQAALAQHQGEEVYVVFDRSPGPDAPRFVEVETKNGEGRRVGEWIKRDDGFWTLGALFTTPPTNHANAEAMLALADKIEARAREWGEAVYDHGIAWAKELRALAKGNGDG